MKFSGHMHDTIRYDTIVEFNVDSKAEYTMSTSLQFKYFYFHHKNNQVIGK